MLSDQNDLNRLKTEYLRRSLDPEYKEIYSLFNESSLFIAQQRQRYTLRILKRLGFDHLPDLWIAEMGCGTGGILAEFLAFGVPAKHLIGIDLLPERIREGRQHNPAFLFVNADGQNMPFEAATFDIVLQYTAFSSILDEQIKNKVAGDMQRLVKPGGLILWYDFWLNPTNPQTRGIRPAEVRRLFPGCQYTFRKITLAPPLSRRIVPFSWGLALFLESLKIFNSHYLAAIRPSL